MTARNAKSATALRVSDDPAECEGMAGLVYEEGFCIASNLPRISKADVAPVCDLRELPASHPVRRYAEATRISDLTLLKAFENFGSHYMGVLIRKNNGTPWGVLLLDSEEERCPFPQNGDGAHTRERLESYARMMSKLVG